MTTAESIARGAPSRASAQARRSSIRPQCTTSSTRAKARPSSTSRTSSRRTQRRCSAMSLLRPSAGSTEGNNDLTDNRALTGSRWPGKADAFLPPVREATRGRAAGGEILVGGASGASGHPETLTAKANLFAAGEDSPHPPRGRDGRAAWESKSANRGDADDRNGRAPAAPERPPLTSAPPWRSRSLRVVDGVLSEVVR